MSHTTLMTHSSMRTPMYVRNPYLYARKSKYGVGTPYLRIRCTSTVSVPGNPGKDTLPGSGRSPMVSLLIATRRSRSPSLNPSRLGILNAASVLRLTMRAAFRAGLVAASLRLSGCAPPVQPIGQNEWGLVYPQSLDRERPGEVQRLREGPFGLSELTLG